MPVEQRLHLFGDWIEADVALDQDRVEAGDRSPGGRAGALKEPRQRGEDRWRIAATRGRLAGGEADLALRAGEACQAVHEQQHVPPAVAEEFRDRHGHMRGLYTLHRRPVRCGRDDHGALLPLDAELMLDEFADLAAALADQRDHDYIGVSAADDIAEQCGLAEPRRAEYSDALAAAAGQQAVDRRDAESDRTIDERARQRRWRLGIDRMKALDLVVRPALSIQWLAQRVDNAPDEAGADRDPQLFPTRQHFSDVRQAAEIADRREDGDVFGKADHLGGHPALRRRIDQMANFADAYLGDRGVDDRAEQAAHAPLDECGISSEHRILQARQDRSQSAFYVELAHRHACTSGGVRRIGCPGALARIALSIAASCTSMPALITANGVCSTILVRLGKPGSASMRTLMPDRAVNGCRRASTSLATSGWTLATTVAASRSLPMACLQITWAAALITRSESGMLPSTLRTAAVTVSTIWSSIVSRYLDTSIAVLATCSDMAF